jgi:hypothetical protein
MKQSKANRNRAKEVEAVIDVFRREAATKADAPLRTIRRDETLVDLLSNIRHWCDSRGLEFHVLDRLAYRHYSEELGENPR